MKRNAAFWIASAVMLFSGNALSAEKVEINIVNSRTENVVMRFEYAFRQYTWLLTQHKVDAQDEITYRFPANIPGCEYLREWHITDGILSISNAVGLVCEKRISLCDRKHMVMTVRANACSWAEEK